MSLQLAIIKRKEVEYDFSGSLYSYMSEINASIDMLFYATQEWCIENMSNKIDAQAWCFYYSGECIEFSEELQIEYDAITYINLLYKKGELNECIDEIVSSFQTLYSDYTIEDIINFLLKAQTISNNKFIVTLQWI